MDAVKVREWHMFLGTREAEDAVGTLLRLSQRLDDAWEDVGHVLRVVAGSPSHHLEETLRVARTTLIEGAVMLQDAAAEIRRHDTDAA